MSISFHLPPPAKSISELLNPYLVKIEAYQHQLASRPTGAVMISRIAGMLLQNCMIPDPFPCTVFAKGSATPYYSRLFKTY